VSSIIEGSESGNIMKYQKLTQTTDT